MYNLTRYKIGDKVIVGRDDNGYPWAEGIVIGKAPKMLKLRFEGSSYFGETCERWLSADEWRVIAKLATEI